MAQYLCSSIGKQIAHQIHIISLRIPALMINVSFSNITCLEHIFLHPHFLAQSGSYLTHRVSLGNKANKPSF